ncbi:MAG: hypothetical protein WCX81_06885 [Monoglobales bacterium]
MIKDKNIEISKKEYLTFRYFAFLYDYTGVAVVLWTTFLGLVVLWDYFMTRRSFIIAVIGIYMIASNINNIFFKMPKTARTEYASGTFSNPKYTFSLTEDTITISRETTSPSVIGLTNLYSVFETFFHFCFFISKNNYLILPKSLLSDDEIAFVRKAKKALPRINRRNPFSPGIKAAIKKIATLAFITVCAIIVVIAYKYT